MDFTRLGSSGLVVSRLGLGCNNFGLRPARARPHSIPVLRARRRRRAHAVRHRRHLRRRRERGVLGEALEGRPRRRGVATKFGIGHAGRATARTGARAASRRYIRKAVEALAAPAAHRPHRPLPAAPARPDDPDRGDPGRAARAGPRGQGPLHRLLQLRRLAGRRRRLDRPEPAASSGSSARRTSTPCSTARSRPSWCRPASTSGSGILPFFPLASGLLTGKYRRGEEAPEGHPARRRGPARLERRRVGPDRGARGVRRRARASSCSTSPSVASPRSRPWRR